MTGEGNHPKRHRVLLTLAALFSIPVLVALAWFAWQTAAFYGDIKAGGSTIEDRRLDASISKLVTNANVKPADLAKLVPVAGLYPELGNRNARVTIVEFVDYQCPFCQRSAPVVRRIMLALGERARFIVRDFPILDLHPGAKISALAANCVLEQGQEVYWKYHDLLFAEIDKQEPADLRAKAETAGARISEYDTCVQQERYFGKIEADIQTGLQVGVQGTPTFFVNGIKVQGAQDEKTLTRVINAVMEQVPQ